MTTRYEELEHFRNIHGELLPEGYRFSADDEKRLNDLDFYNGGERILPPTEVTGADRFMAWRWYGQFMSPMREDFLKSMAWRISRERQCLSLLSENRAMRELLKEYRERHQRVGLCYWDASEEMCSSCKATVALLSPESREK
jgi:hypothetical protein